MKPNNAPLSYKQAINTQHVNNTYVHFTVVGRFFFSYKKIIFDPSDSVSSVWELISFVHSNASIFNFDLNLFNGANRHMTDSKCLWIETRNCPCKFLFVWHNRQIQNRIAIIQGNLYISDIRLMATINHGRHQLNIDADWICTSLQFEVTLFHSKSLRCSNSNRYGKMKLAHSIGHMLLL